MAGDQLRTSIADDECARIRQITQRLNRALGLALLVEGEGQRDQHHGKECQAFVHITQHGIEQSRHQEQQEHGLTQGLCSNLPVAAPLTARQHVGALLRQALLGLLCGQARCVVLLRSHATLKLRCLRAVGHF
jgi:hypothetical protein